MNSPRAFESLRIFVERSGTDLLIGAGTVLSAEEAVQVAKIGARLMVAPNADPSVIAKAHTLGLATLPGVATPSEALAALKAGAEGSEDVSGRDAAAGCAEGLGAVLPSNTLLVPVGGLSLDLLAKIGMPVRELSVSAQRFTSRDLHPRNWVVEHAHWSSAAAT